MARTIALAVAVSLVLACAEREKPLSEPGEKVYDIRGTILVRDTGDNTIRLEHETIPGFMEAMTMDFSVRGARVAALPPDGSRVDANLHVTDSGFWLTGIRKVS